MNIHYNMVIVKIQFKLLNQQHIVKTVLLKLQL